MHYTYLLLSKRDQNRDDALRRERFLKTGKGERFLKNRLAAFLQALSPNTLKRH